MPIVILSIMTLLISFLNYVPKTFLSGWDTLHPEFNLLLNFQRVFFGVWRADQGLGAVAAHSQMSELPRLLLLSIFSISMPLDFIRYAYVFFCFVIGPISIYFFLNRVTLKHQTKHIRILTSLLGALFYIFNLGTLQTFYVPFEMFPTQYAYIGWIFLFAFLYLEKPLKKYLLFFLLALFFASPMAYAAQLWYAFFLVFTITVVGYGLLTNKKILKKGILLVILTIVVNSYWLFPNLYYIKNYSQVPEQALENRVYSNEFFAQNQKYGTFWDTALLKNFYFNWTQYNPQAQQVEFLMPQWRNYFHSIWVQVLGYLFFIGVVIGSVLSIRKQKKIGLPFTIAGGIAFFFIANNIPIIDSLTGFLRDHISIFREALRFPFDKFAVVLLFFYVVFFSESIAAILYGITRKVSKKYIEITSLSFTGIVMILFIWYMFPIFQGQFIDPFMKINIPSSYFSLNNWLNTENTSGRILKLPMNSYTGWIYYAWGYQGSGFNWFGIPQPTFDRNSDRWYPYNEESYREISYALYAQKPNIFEKLLQKYNITYILLDTSIIAPGDPQGQQLFYPQTERLLREIPSIHLAKKIGSNIFVYQYEPNKTIKNITLLKSYQDVLPSYQWNFLDNAYMKYGNYISAPPLEGQSDVLWYPTRNFFNTDDTINTHVLQEKNSSYTLSFQSSKSEAGVVSLPNLSDAEKQLFANVESVAVAGTHQVQLDYSVPSIGTYNTYQNSFSVSPTTKYIAINDYAFSIPQQVDSTTNSLGKILTQSGVTNTFSEYSGSGAILPVNKSFSPSPYNCSETTQYPQFFGLNTITNGFEIYNQNSKVCLTIPLNQLFPTIMSKEASQLIKVSFSYLLQNKSNFTICITNTSNNNCLESTEETSGYPGLYTGLIPINSQNNSSMALTFVFNNNESYNSQTTSILNLSATSYPNISSKTFTTNAPAYSILTNSFTLQGPTLNPTEVDLNKLVVQKKDCSMTKATFIGKSMVTTINGQAVRYETINGTNCDELTFPTLSHNMGYILHFASSHEEGLPLRICLMDTHMQRCTLEENLPESAPLSNSDFLIPPSDNGSGYSLLISNISIDTPSINELSNITITPFPYNYLQQISWSSSVQDSQTNSAATIQEIANTPDTYAFTLSGGSNTQVVALNEAYEKNWRLYNVPAFIANSPILQYLAPILGQEVTTHTSVNNWENGWEIHATPTAQAYVAIFLPQYLEFLGFILLGGAFLYVLIDDHRWHHFFLIRIKKLKRRLLKN